MKIHVSECQLEIVPEGGAERRNIEKKTNLAMRKFGVSSRVARIFAAVAICTELRDDISVDMKHVHYQDRSFSIYPSGLDGASYPEVTVCP
jgi:hypothetical protein